MNVIHEYVRGLDDIVYRYIQEAFAPFVAGRLSISSRMDISTGRREACAYFSNLPGEEFWIEVIESNAISMAPKDWHHHVGQKFFEAIRYRPITPREPNIILGEE